MATIEPYETEAGRRYMVRYRTPERRQTKRRGFRTKREAEEFAATVEVQKLKGEYVDLTRSRVTIGELGPDWISRQTHLKPSSYRPIEIAWRVHVEPRWGSVRLSELEFSAVQKWVSVMSGEKGATTVKRAFGVLSSIVDDAVRDRRILSNPCRGVKTPRKVSKQPEYLTHDQVAALATAAGDNSTIVLVLAYTGLRWGEVAGLRIKDIDLTRRRLNVNQNAVRVGSKLEIGTPKGHERRSVPFPALLDAALKDQARGKLPEALLFPAIDGAHLRRSKSGKGWFWRAAKAISREELTPHDLRHTAASLAVAAGANVKVVQRMLGHKSAAMTLDTYADLFDGDLDSVATAMNAAAVASASKRQPS